jgi:hypothetical protein
VTAASVTDPAKTPGAMQHTKRRDLTDGSVIEFEEAPAGWLTRDGDVRQQDHRAYYLTVPGDDCELCEGTGRRYDQSRRGRRCEICAGTGSMTRRTRLASVSTILDAICPKGGLPFWAEARGIEGAVEMVRDGRLDPHTPGLAPVAAVRKARMGADRARDDAAERGLDIHAILENYMLTGRAPNPADYPPHLHGYIRGLVAWLLKAQPEPLAVEELVCSPSDGYAGRMDLRAIIGGLVVAVDLKTQENGCIYPAAHLQVGLYERAVVACGDEPADLRMVVVVAANGEFRDMQANHDERMIDTTLAFYHDVAKPLNSVCESANRIEREARKVVAS